MSCCPVWRRARGRASLSHGPAVINLRVRGRSFRAGVFIGVPPQTGGSIASTGSPALSIPVRPLSGLAAKKKPAGCTGRAESSGARITRGDTAPGRLKPNSSAAAPRLQCLSLQRSIVGCAGFLGLWLGFSPAGAAAEQVLVLWIGPSHVFLTFALGFELLSLGSKVFE